MTVKEDIAGRAMGVAGAGLPEGLPEARVGPDRSGAVPGDEKALVGVAQPDGLCVDRRRVGAGQLLVAVLVEVVDVVLLV